MTKLRIEYTINTYIILCIVIFKLYLSYTFFIDTILTIKNKIIIFMDMIIYIIHSTPIIVTLLQRYICINIDTIIRQFIHYLLEFI